MELLEDEADLFGAVARERLFVESGEFVDAQALSPEGTFVRYDGDGKEPVTEEERKLAFAQGRRLAAIASRLVER